MDARADLLAKIDEYLASSGENIQAFGFNAARDPGIVSRLRKGRNIGLDKYSDLLAYMDGKRREAAAREAG